MLSNEEKNYFLYTINKLREQLEVSKTKDTLQELERFENQLTLNELEQCLFDTSPEIFNPKLKELLTQRWERIRNSSMCYTLKPDNKVNQLCLKLAIAISPPITTESEIEALESNTGPYFLLMPSLENGEDVYGQNIHQFRLHELVLSDKERVYIPIVDCLHDAAVSDQGILRHIVTIDGINPELSASEIERVSKHSGPAAKFYQSILELNLQRLMGKSIGAKLTQLAVALRQGGSHGSGSELNAGAKANLGILAFNKYWEGLSKTQKSAILAETPKLKDVIGRLFRPEDVNYKETRFCVELLANALDRIIKAYNKNPSIQTLITKVEAQESACRAALKVHHNLKKIEEDANPPKHLLHHIFKLPISKQKEIFKWDPYKNALLYTLAREPEELSEFDLDEAAKQSAISIRILPNNDSALIAAAKLGSIKTVKLLLSWGADIEAQDKKDSTSLHWAANNGHVDIVEYLLEQGALLEARGNGLNTALNFAVMHGKLNVVSKLLKKNADINARNLKGQNALDLAIAHEPELIEPILLKLATLPADKQAECLLNVPDGPYLNVLLYAAATKPDLFNALMAAISEQPNITSTDALLTTADKKGSTPLILAAQLGAKESVKKLIDLGVDIESHNLYGNTALVWAANNGHTELVDYLLESGALSEAKGETGNTPLNWAVWEGQSSTVKLLLKKNADINVRNEQGMNALDIAIEKHPKLVKPIVMHLATLPVDKQAECLLNVSGGPYPNVFFHAAVKANRISLVDDLLPAFNNKELDFKMQDIHKHIHHVARLYQKKKTKNHKNLDAETEVSTAETLLKTCTEELLKVYQNSDNPTAQILEFKNKCQSAIETAKPGLTKDKQWGKVLALLLLAVITLPISLPLYAAGFFTLKTEPEKLLDDLQKNVNKLK